MVEGPRAIELAAREAYACLCGPELRGEAGQISTEHVNGGSILVADDDEGILDLLLTLLRDAGYAARGAGSGAEALALAELEQPRLVILDVCMPDISGYEVCRRLREQHGDHVPILFLSGERIDPVDRAAGLVLGGDDYLVKPFSPEELLARVAGLIRRMPYAGTPKQAKLSVRELEVLGLLAAGLRRHEIARQLVISPKTVSAHLSRIYEKLGARDRVQAVIVAYRTRLLEPL